MRIYNTLTRKKEEFIPRDGSPSSSFGEAGKKVKMFVCGPTVYDYSHIGHAKTYIFYDTFARYLEFKGFEVYYLQNITDIDNKIIDRAKQQDKDPIELAREFEKYYLEDMQSLGIKNVKYARATDYIPQIISQVKRLINKGFAYKIENDGYYFDLSKFPEYGKLSGRTIEGAEDAVSRIDEGVNKRNKGDFCLWKFSNLEKSSWPSELGNGRPGWHIEDTAITESEFGPQYDIHGGALELMFPHHEAEIAQMESISGLQPLVKYWIHTGLLTINGKKMSKSLGNFITIRDTLKKYSPEAVRFMTLSAHYRSPLDYSEKNMDSSEAAYQRIREFRNKLELQSDHNLPPSKTIGNAIQEAKNLFDKAMDDDFNTPKAFATLFDFISIFNKIFTDKVSGKDMLAAKELLEIYGKIFGIIPNDTNYSNYPQEVQELINQRQNARERKDFDEADKLRDKISNLGYQMDDTIYGPLVKKI